MAAFDKLSGETGKKDVVLKECYSASGDDITFWNSRKDIEDKFEWKERYKYVNVEENLKLSDNLDSVVFVGRSYYDSKPIGCGAVNIIIGDSSYGGSTTYTQKIIDAKLDKIVQQVINKIGATFMGGFDFAVQTFKDKSIEQVKIYLIDMNTGRYTAPTQTFMAMEKFAIPKDRYFIRKNLSIRKDASFKKLVEENGHILLNILEKRGTYFHMFGPPLYGEAVVSIFGKDEQDANELLVELQNIKSLCK